MLETFQKIDGKKWYHYARVIEAQYGNPASLEISVSKTVLQKAINCDDWTAQKVRGVLLFTK